MEGDFWCHCKNILGTMRDVKVLTSVGITQCAAAGSDKCYVMIQDELSELFGEFSLLLACKRLERTLWFLQGLPHRLPLVPSKKHGMAHDTLKEFRLDWECYEALQVAAETCETCETCEAD